MIRPNTRGQKFVISTLMAVTLILSPPSSRAQEDQRIYDAMEGLGNDIGKATLQGQLLSISYKERVASPSVKWTPPPVPLTITSTYTVTTTANAGSGSLRDALDSANRGPDLTAITFNMGGGTHTITLLSALPIVNYPVIIDGSAGGIPAIELNGSSAGATANGLYLKGGNSVVRGLIINRFTGGAGLNGFGIVLDVLGGNIIEGNFIGTDVSGTIARPNRVGLSITGASSGNIIGGTTPEARNVISGNVSSGISTLNGTAGGNFVIGNFIGLTALGTAALGNGGNGLFIVSPANTIGGLEQGARNVISGNVLPGVAVGAAGSGTVLQGNYIGTDSTGTVVVGNVQNGIIISSSSNNVIGGASPEARNIISGNGRSGAGFPGIVITGTAASGNSIRGNYIGTDVSGENALGNGSGININGAPNNTVGGEGIGEGNLISGNIAYGVGTLNAGATGNKIINNIIGSLDNPSLGNGSHGVRIISSLDTVMLNSISYNGGSGVYDSAGTQNLIIQNSIFANGGRGIDLAPTGLAINDSLDNDTGPNNLQNFPILDSARVEGDHFIVNVRINSKPNSQISIDFYTNDDYDPSHFGEGQYWATQVQVPTDARGNCKFWTAVPIHTGLDNYITATATDQQGNTSEFSQALCILDSDGDGILDSWETHGWGIDVNSDGIIDLDLDLLGARPNHRDIFVEVDAMTGLAPQATTLPYVVRSFANSKNGGISLHITPSDSTITPVPWLLNWWTSFDAVKRAYFGTQEDRASPNARFVLEAKRLVYRYCVFAYQHTTGTWSGRAEEHFPQGCDDFMVTMGPWPTSGGTESQKAGTFMHELGHTLGLRHGGSDEIGLKTNYISVMNYTWQTPHDWMNKWPLNYSPEALPTLIESNLDELAGLGVPTGWQHTSVLNVPFAGPLGSFLQTKLKPNQSVDWNNNGSIDAGGIAADLNAFLGAGSSPGETLISQDDWSKLILNFRNSPDFSTGARSTPLSLPDELDLDTWQLIHSIPPPKPKGEFVMDGQLDTSAVLVASNAGISLYVRYKSGQLYVATNSAQSQGADMFIFISDARNSLRAAPSGKAGQVAAWSVYLSNTMVDNSTEWFDTLEVPLTNITVDTVGSVFEGVIDVELLYGKLPTDLFIAVGKYGTNAGGALLTQVPAGNGNSNIEPPELLQFSLPLTPAYAYLTQEGDKLVGTGAVNGVAGAGQGKSVSLSSDGNTAIVGGEYDDNGTGAAWVYTRSGGLWSQQGSKLVGTGANGSAHQGYSVAISSDGNTAIVGGSFDGDGGAAWVYVRIGPSWFQQGTKLVGTGAVGSSEQGFSVALSSDGNTAIVGGRGDNGGVGAAWVFRRNGGVWNQQGGKLVGTGAVGTAWQGSSVALSSDGNTAIVGGRIDNGAAGAAWVFTRSGTVWSQQGSKLVGTGAFGPNVNQGASVALSSDGNTAIVGGPGDNDFFGQFIIGATWVYSRTGGAWTQMGTKLVGLGVVGGYSWQGFSVSLSSDGNTAIVGGYGDNNNAGATWVFTQIGGVWGQRGSKLIGTGAAGQAFQGISVAVSSDGNTAIVGGHGDSSGVGAAWVFTHDAPLPIQLTSFTAIIVNGRHVRLDWTTLSEINNYGFEIQRSPENENNYQTLQNSFIPGHGTTNEPQHYSYVDGTGAPAHWYYRLRQIDLNGTVHYTDGITINTLTGVSGGLLPDKFALSQNYPDPFNPSTTIQYQLPQAAHVTLKIYNLLGQEVVTLVDGVEAPGYKSAVWNATNVASGVYFYRIVATSGQTAFVDLRKMLMMK